MMTSSLQMEMSALINELVARTPSPMISSRKDEIVQERLSDVGTFDADAAMRLLSLVRDECCARTSGLLVGAWQKGASHGGATQGFAEGVGTVSVRDDGDDTASYNFGYGNFLWAGKWGVGYFSDSARLEAVGFLPRTHRHVPLVGVSEESGFFSTAYVLSDTYRLFFDRETGLPLVLGQALFKEFSLKLFGRYWYLQSGTFCKVKVPSPC